MDVGAGWTTNNSDGMASVQHGTDEIVSFTQAHNLVRMLLEANMFAIMVQ